MTSDRHFGYRPDPVDARDRMRAARPGQTRITERRMDLLITHVRDQGQTSSCVGNAIASGVELLLALMQKPIPRLSEAHAYWLARAVDGYQDEDAGAHIRSGIRALRKVGCCGQSEWPLRRERINERPPLSAEMSGIRFADLAYERVTSSSEAVLDALQDGAPVIFGTQVGNVFADWRGDGTIPAPAPREVMLGGHALVAVGFTDAGRRVRVLNSWGTSFADGGLCWMSSDWFNDPRTQDCWALVPNGVQP